MVRLLVLTTGRQSCWFSSVCVLHIFSAGSTSRHLPGCSIVHSPAVNPSSCPAPIQFPLSQVILASRARKTQPASSSTNYSVDSAVSQHAHRHRSRHDQPTAGPEPTAGLLSPAAPGAGQNNVQHQPIHASRDHLGAVARPAGFGATLGFRRNAPSRGSARKKTARPRRRAGCEGDDRR